MDSEIKKVEKALGEPFAADFPEYVRKIRNGLIVTSVISISLLLGDLQIAADSSVLGLKFERLSNDLILRAMFFLNAYTFVHFLWCSFDSFQEWILRVTGTRVAHVTAARAASEYGDYPNDPRQSTLYNWWKDESRKIGSIREPLERIENDLKGWEEKVRTALEGKDPNVGDACTSINQVSEDIKKLKNSIENASKAIESKRIPVSLKRFDSHFKLFLRSQNLRWLVVELLFPLLLGGYALILLAYKL